MNSNIIYHFNPIWLSGVPQGSILVYFMCFLFLFLGALLLFRRGQERTSMDRKGGEMEEDIRKGHPAQDAAYS